MHRRTALSLQPLRRPLAAGVAALYLALAILAHFAHETPARAAQIDPLGVGAPICWGGDAAAPTPTPERKAAVCEACLLAKSLCAPPPNDAAAIAAPAMVGSATVKPAATRSLTAYRAPRPPARGPPIDLS